MLEGKGAILNGCVVALIYGVLAAVTAVGIAYVVESSTSFVSDVVAIWIVGTIWGLAMTGATFRDTLRERYRAGDNEVLSSITNGNVRREGFRMLELIALLCIGILILTGYSTTLNSRVLVLFVVIMLVANSTLDRIERNQTNKTISESIRRSKTHGIN